jgi:hypothetical protein
LASPPSAGHDVSIVEEVAMAGRACRATVRVGRKLNARDAFARDRRHSRRCTVMVDVSGTRDALAHVPPNVDAFEFRYEPEVGSIHRLLLSTLDSVRQERAAKE